MRAFRGNKHIKIVVQQCCSPNETNVATNENVDRPRPTPPSASRKKLGIVSSECNYSDFEGGSRNFIVNMVALETLFENVGCKKCGGVVNIEEVDYKRNGLACQLCVTCTSCKYDFIVWTSDKCTDKHV